MLMSHLIVAQVFRNRLDYLRKHYGGEVRPISELQGLAQDMADAFAEADPSFDPVAFMRACGVEFA